MFGGARSRLVALLAVLVLACGGAAQAHPVDAPGYGTAGEAENGHVRITGALDTARDRIDPAQVSVRINGTDAQTRSEKQTSELQSLMRNSYAVFCLKETTQTQ